MELSKNNIKILVPVPLTHEFSVPLNQALHFNNAYSTEIILLNVVPDHSLADRIMNSTKLKRNNYEASARLRLLANNYFGGEIPGNVNLKVVNGQLVPSILKEAENQKCDLIIIKKAEKLKKYFNLLKAENADKLIAEAVCPIMTISGRPACHRIKDILLPVDIFKQTDNKVAWAISMAKKFSAKLHVVSVVEMDIKPEDSLSYKKCKKIENAIRKEGIEVDTALLKSGKKSMAKAVLDYSTELDPDLVMIMTHKESVLIDNYLGSFARQIIHGSPVPVFSAVPGKETILEGFFSTLSAKAN